jgi:hypothetical protein
LRGPLCGAAPSSRLEGPPLLGGGPSQLSEPGLLSTVRDHEHCSRHHPACR